MTPQQQSVLDFHVALGHYFNVRPTLVPRDVFELRYTLILEELTELQAGWCHGDLVECADALGDLLYVVLGAACAFGVDLEEVFREIHRTNMLKVGGVVRADGKQLKPKGWEPPRLAEILEAQA